MDITLIVGPSASGKSFLCSAYENIGYRWVEHCSTRPRRRIREKGHFYKEDGFNSLVARGDIICPRQFGNGWWYGFPKWELKLTGKPIVIGTDIESAVDLVGWGFENEEGADEWPITILDVPESVRRARLLLRGDAPEEIDRRVSDERSIYRNFELKRTLMPYTLMKTSIIGGGDVIS